MKTVLKIVSISLLSGLVASHAFAERGRHDWRAMNQQQPAQPQPMQPQVTDPAPQDNRYVGLEESAVASTADTSIADEARKSGKLTADERRALRRQINEAARDIYSSPTR